MIFPYEIFTTYMYNILKDLTISCSVLHVHEVKMKVNLE